MAYPPSSPGMELPGFGVSHFAQPETLKLMPPLEEMTWESIDIKEKDGLIRVEMNGTSNYVMKDESEVEILLADVLQVSINRGRLSAMHRKWLDKLGKERHTTFTQDKSNHEDLEFLFQELGTEGIGIARDVVGGKYHWRIFIVQSIPSFLRAVSQNLALTPGAPQPNMWPNMWGFVGPGPASPSNAADDFLNLYGMFTGKTADPDARRRVEEALEKNPEVRAYAPMLRAMMPGMFPGDSDPGLSGEEAQKRMELERKSEELAREYRSAKSAGDAKEMERIETELDSVLDESFVMRLDGYKKKISELNGELSDLQGKLDTRVSNKQAIIDKRRAQLLGEEQSMEW